MKKHILLFLFIIFHVGYTYAQLSDLHYLPPLKQGLNNQAIRQQAFYLSTPETTSFDVFVYQGVGVAPIAVITNLSKGASKQYNIGDGDNNITLVTNTNTGVILNNSGLRFESNAGQKFYVNYRGRSDAQATSLTSKGRQALGTLFKWGGIPNRAYTLDTGGSGSNRRYLLTTTLGIMATENNTTVTISGYDPNCEFRSTTNEGGLTDNVITRVLNAGQTFVLEALKEQTTANIDGWLGATIQSDKKIAISFGGLNAGVRPGSQARDAVIDQPVSQNVLGKEYVFVRGNGVNETEFAIIIGTNDGTEIFVNGSPTAIQTINTGDYYIVPGSNYSSTNAGANMYITTSKSAYAYQTQAGSSGIQTIGFNFVLPLNCLLPDSLDGIPNIRDVDGSNLNGGITIIAASSIPDADMVIRDDTGIVPLPASIPVGGTPDWKTYYVPGLTGDVSVASTGPIAVGFVGVNNNQGIAGYFSGFDQQAIGDIEFSPVALDPTVPIGDSERTQIKLQGDFTMFGNNVTKIQGSGTTPFDTRTLSPSSNNNNKSYEYVDIDTDASTFSSSSANFVNTSDCSQVVYAGLYWTSTYYIIKDINGEEITSCLPITDDRNGPAPDGDGLNAAFGLNPNTTFRDIKFKHESMANYVDISVSETPAFDGSQVIYDGWRNTTSNPSDGAAKDIPYLCYANITSIVQGLGSDAGDAEGTYTVGNIRSTVGLSNAGVSGGWIMVVIYEDPSLSRKLISSQSGFKQVASDQTVTFDYDGFTSLPAPNPIRAKYGIAGLEGDTGIQGDQLQIRDTNGNFIPLSTNPNGDVLNEPTNFFDSSISLNGSLGDPSDLPNSPIVRNPFALNTLGLDIDVFSIPNPSNDVIGNGQSLVQFQNVTGGDSYTTFLNTFAIEIIEPELVVKKRVLDGLGNDITGSPVGLGQEIVYRLIIENQGNEGIINAVITDQLPENVIFDFDDPATLNFDANIFTNVTYDAPTRILRLEIADNFVERFDGEFYFEFRVSIVDDCTKITDACSNSIDNVARSAYMGVESRVSKPKPGEEELSILDQDPVCRFDIVGTSNVILGFADLVARCGAVTSDAFVCTEDIPLTAGAGFATYEWRNADTGALIGTTQSIDVGPSDFPTGVTTLTYVVDKRDPDCPDLQETWNITALVNIENPIVAIANGLGDRGEVLNCADNGDQEYPQLLLCGASDEINLALGSQLAGATNVRWERLAFDACPAVTKNDNCPTDDVACESEWTEVEPNNASYLLQQSGEYRITATFSPNSTTNCSVTFFFKAFKNEFNPQLDEVRPIICGVPGALQVINSATQYEYELQRQTSATTFVVERPYQASPLFENLSIASTYSVNVRLASSPGPCVFTSQQTLNNINGVVTPSIKQPNCSTDRGTIRFTVTNGLPNYTYRIRSTTGTFTAEIPATIDSSGEFTGLTAGDYDVEVFSNNNDTNCVFTQTLTVAQTYPSFAPVAVLNRDLSCNPNYQPNPALCALDETHPNFRECDFDEFIALFEINVTPLPVPPATANYSYAISSDGGATKTPIIPELGTSNLFRINASTDPVTPTAVGVYTVYVTDLNSNCEEQSNTIPVTDYIPVAATAALTAPVCPGDLGSIAISVTAGEGPFEYVLDAGLPTEQTLSGAPSEINSGSQTFVNLAGAATPGRAYTVQVTDRFGCDVAVLPNITIVTPTVITADIDITQPYQCDLAGTGIQTATIEVTNPMNGTASYAPYAYSIDGTDFTNTTGVFTGLTDGTYTVYIRDGNTTACPVNLGDLTIDPLQEVTDITYTQSAITCPTETTIVTLTAVGTNGASSFEYSLDNVTYTATNTFTLNADGSTYTLYAKTTTDGCVYSESITIAAIDQPVVTGMMTSEPTCVGDADGVLSFSVSGIDLTATTYSYEITGGTIPLGTPITGGTDITPINTSPTPQTGLGAGTYTVTVTETTTGCSDDTTIEITEPALALSFTTATDAADCGANTGSITVTATGGSGGYEYELRDAAGTGIVAAYQTSNLFSGLAGATYQVRVRDGNSASACEVVSTPVVLGETTPATIALASGDLCYDAINQANRTVNITGGVGPYTYSLNGGGPVVVAASPFTIPNLTPDSYTVSVTDTNNCVSNTENFTIAAELMITPSFIKDQDCSVTPNAQISVTTIGGNGMHTVEVTDNGGTTYTDITPALFSGGTFTYTVPSLVAVVTIYQFRVTDSGIAASGASNCTHESAVFRVNPSPDPVASEMLTHISCNGEMTGIIDITIDTSVGTGPYTVALNGPTVGSTFGFSAQTLYSGLPGGDYTYQVRDAKECTLTSATVTITEPAVIIANDPQYNPNPLLSTIVPIQCTGGGFTYGAATINNVMGGSITTTGYTYTLFDSGTGLPAVNPATTPPPASDPIPAIPFNQITTTNTTQTFTELYFGTYYITVEDENSCIYTSAPFTISSPPDDLSFDVVPVASDCNATGAVYDIVINNGSRPYEIRIVDIPGFDVFIPTNGVVDAGTTLPLGFIPDPTVEGNLHQYTGLTFSIPYIVEIRDAGGCIYKEPLAPVPAPSTISVTERFTAPSTTGITNVDCFGSMTGSIDFTVDGYAGTDIEWDIFNNATGVPAGSGSASSAAPYDGQVSGLSVGSYVVSFYTPAERFCAASLIFNIMQPSALDLDVISVKDQLCDLGGTPRLGEVVVIGRGGTSPYTYDTSPAGTFTNTDGRFSLAAGSHNFYVRDAGGCTFPVIPATVGRTINLIPGPAFDVVPTYTDCPFPSAGYSFTVSTTTDGTGDLEYGIAPDDGSGDPFDTEVPAYVVDTPRDNSFEYTVTTPGTYNLYVRDANGCVDASQIVIIPDVFVTASVSTVPSCTASDGSITATVTGGSATFGNWTFDLIDISTGVTLVGVTQTPNIPMNQMVFGTIPPGNYRVEVIDSALPATVNCAATFTISVETPVSPTFTTDPEDVSCNGGNDGEIRVTITTILADQDPAYTYRLFDFTGSVRGAQIGVDETDGVFTSLVAGLYEVEVETDSGCISTTAPTGVTIGEPTVISADPAVVGNYTCTASNDEVFPQVTIAISGGTAPYRISYTAPSAANSVSNQPVVDGDVVTPGIQYVFTAVESGTYSSITILDANNCSLAIADAVVPAFPIMSAASVTQVTAIDCTNGQETVTVSVTGGREFDNTTPVAIRNTFVFREILGSGLVSAPINAAVGDGFIAGTTSTTFNLSAVGNYQFEIEDVTTGCTIRTTPIYEVAEFNTIEAVLSNPTDITCFNTPSDGTLDLTINGYSGPYQYTITTVNSSGMTTSAIFNADSSVQNPEPITGLSDGNITITATVVIGGVASTVCIDASNTINIAPAPVITITTAEQVNPESCMPGDDASIQIGATGGTGVLEYKIERITSAVGVVPPFETTVLVVDYGLNPNTNPGLFTGLDAGVLPDGMRYRVFSRDTRGCEVSEVVAIVPPTPLGVNAPVMLMLDCSDSKDGTIDVTANGGLGSGAGGTGTGTYFFQLTFPDGSQSTAVPSNGVANGLTAAEHRFIGLSEGAGYVITVTDGTVGCPVTTNFTLTVPTPVTVDVAPSGFSCTALAPNPTRVQVTGAGGAGGYSFFYIKVDDPSPMEMPLPANPFTFTDLGEYDFYARDTKGCTSNASTRISVTPPEAFEFKVDESNLNIVCYDEATASVDIVYVRGGLGNYEYRIVGTEESGATVELPGPGTATQSDPFFPNLRAGSYTYFVSSGTGGVSCTVIDEGFTVKQPAEFIVPAPTVEDITCNGAADGRITVLVSGGNVADPGNSRYFYSLFDSSGNAIFQFIEDEVDNVLGSHTFDELSAGIYQVGVEDSRGCSVLHDTLEIIEPPAIQVSTLATTPEECAGDSNGTATIAIIGGTQAVLPANREYYWSLTGDAGSYQLAVNPTSLVISNLPGGINTIFIRDSRNNSDCELPYNVSIAPGVAIAATLVDRKECPILDATGAVTQPTVYYVDFGLTANSDPSRTDGIVAPNDIVYTLTGINGTADPANNMNLNGTFEVVPGEYLGTMLHARGCEVSAGTVIVDQYVPLSLPVGVMTGNPADPNEYEITVTGGVATTANPYVYFAFQGVADADPNSDYEVALENGTYVLRDSSTGELIAIPLEGDKYLVRETGVYTIFAVDGTGCSAVSQQEITYINIRIPNYFRPNDPNSSGEEEFWYPRQITPNSDDPFFFENMEVKLFDRYGRLLAGFKGDQQGWDGLYQGEELPSGDYWFTIILNDAENKEFTGHFTLYR